MCQERVRIQYRKEKEKEDPPTAATGELFSKPEPQQFYLISCLT